MTLLTQHPKKMDLKSLTPSEMEQFIAPYGKERYRTSQLLRWLYKEGVHSIHEMTNLPKRFRQALDEVSVISSLNIRRVEQARDGTKKILFELEDGNCIESVLIPDKRRLTLCVSTQVGCALGCRFCLTGKKGLAREGKAKEAFAEEARLRQLAAQNNDAGRDAAGKAFKVSGPLLRGPFLRLPTVSPAVGAGSPAATGRPATEPGGLQAGVDPCPGDHLLGDFQSKIQRTGETAVLLGVRLGL